MRQGARPGRQPTFCIAQGIGYRLRLRAVMTHNRMAVRSGMLTTGRGRGLGRVVGPTTNVALTHMAGTT